MTGGEATERPRIGAYSFGRVEIDGRVYTSDVVILPTRVIGDWWRDEGHALTPGDLTDVLDALPDLLIIGQGAQGLMKVTDEALACLSEAGIKTICMPTARAVAIFNERSSQGDNVAAALHLTC
jgi:hypothetical protein